MAIIMCVCGHWVEYILNLSSNLNLNTHFNANLFSYINNALNFHNNNKKSCSFLVYFSHYGNSELKPNWNIHRPNSIEIWLNWKRVQTYLYCQAVILVIGHLSGCSFHRLNRSSPFHCFHVCWDPIWGLFLLSRRHRSVGYSIDLNGIRWLFG